MALQVVETVRVCHSAVPVLVTGADSPAVATGARSDGDNTSAGAQQHTAGEAEEGERVSSRRRRDPRQQQQRSVQMRAKLQGSIVVDAVLLGAPKALALVIHTRSGHSRVCFLSRITSPLCQSPSLQEQGHESVGGSASTSTGRDGAQTSGEHSASASLIAPAARAAAGRTMPAPTNVRGPPRAQQEPQGRRRSNEDVTESGSDSAGLATDREMDESAGDEFATLNYRNRQILASLASSVPPMRDSSVLVYVIRSTSEYSTRVLSEAASVLATPLFCAPSHHNAYECDLLCTLSHAMRSSRSMFEEDARRGATGQSHCLL